MAFADAARIAFRLIKQYIDRVRTAGDQPWLAASSDWPALVLKATIQDTAGATLPLDVDHPDAHLTTFGYTRITAAQNDQILDLVAAEDGELPLADTLLRTPNTLFGNPIQTYAKRCS